MNEHDTRDKAHHGITIRRVVADDEAEIARLAELDSAGSPPAGELIVAELEGRMLAVAAVDGGWAIADPFSRTAELRALLELRAAQLRGRDEERKRSIAPRRRGHAGLAGSPPGAGGRLPSLNFRSF